MRCPYCNHDETQVVETRESDEGGVVRRRRRCQHCEKRFTTYERPEIALPAVVKKDGARVDFDPATGELVEQVLHVSDPGSREVSVRRTDPAPEPVQPLSARTIANSATRRPTRR